MIDWYYIKHRYLAQVRKSSGGDAWLAGTLLTIFGIQVIVMIYAGYPEVVDFIIQLRPGLSVADATKLVFLICLFAAATIFLLFSPPKLHFLHYAVWKTRKIDITAGYLLLVPLSPVQLGGSLLMIPILVRSGEYIDLIAVEYVLLILGIQYLSVALHYTTTRLPIRFIAVALLNVTSIAGLLFVRHPAIPPLWLSGLFLLLAITLAFVQTGRYQRIVGENTETNHRRSIWDGFSFREGWMQLEWALMTRNKRTRSNLIVGFLSIPFIFYVFSNTAEDITFIPIIFIGTVVTAFIMLQHGIYMIGWEGSYFDLLLSRTSLSSFFEFKYRFFVLSSTIMYVISCFSIIWNPVLFLPLTATFFYNIGINSLIIIQGSLKNTVKLSLTQRTVFNTEAINGTLMVNSLLTVLIPALAFALTERWLGEWWGCGTLIAIGLLGLIFHRPLLARITAEAQNRKYQLAKGFRS